MRVLHPLVVLVGCLVASGGATPHPAAAQELGFVVGQGWADRSEMSSPVFVGATLELPLVAPLVVVADYRYRWDRPEVTGFACTGRTLSPDCRQERLDGRFTLRSVSVGFGIRVGVTDRTAGAFDVQRSVFSAGGEWVGRETGSRRPLGNISDRDGWSLAAGVLHRFTPWFSARMGFRFDGSRGALGETLHGGGAFGEATRLWSVEVGSRVHPAR